MILKNRIKQLEAEKADLQAALEACVRAMETRTITSSSLSWYRALDGARAALALLPKNDDGNPPSATQLSPEQKA